MKAWENGNMKKLLFLLLIPFSLQALSLKDDSGALSPPAKEFLALFDIDGNQPIPQLILTLKRSWVQEKKERWEMDPRCEEKRALALPILQKLGCIDSIYAGKKHYDYALVLGALGKTMERRLDFLYQEWQKGVRFDQIYLLTGARQLDPQRESYPAGLTYETDLFIHLFKNHPLSKIAPMKVIDSPEQTLPDGTVRRPDTASTVRDFLKTAPRPGSCLVISTQPFVGYQEAVVKCFLPSSFVIECVGPGSANAFPRVEEDIPQVQGAYPLSVYLDNFVKWLIYEQAQD